MTWVDAVPAILCAMMLAVGPGLAVTAPLPLGVLTRLALAGPASVCVWGVAAVVFGACGLPFHAWQTLPVMAAGGALAFAARRAVPRLERSALPAVARLAVPWALSLLASALLTFWAVPDPDRISQTYDNVFHLSATAAILDGFSASPLTLRALIEPVNTGLAYYPSAWHELAAMTAQLSGTTVPVAFNAAWLAMVGAVWLPGIAWLTQLLVPHRAAAAIAMPLAVSFAWFPSGLLTWGTIYPTALAYALLPAAVAMTVLVVRAVGTAHPASRARAWIVGAAALIVVLVAVGLAHPRVLPTWLLLVAPLLLWRLAAAFLAAWRSGGATRRRAVRVAAWLGAGGIALAIAAFGYAVFGLGLFDEPLEERLSGPQARAVQTIWDGAVQVVLLRGMTGVDGTITAVPVLLSLVVLAGLAIAMRARHMRWIVVSYLLAAALFVLAAGSDDVVTKLLTGVWYKDRFRLAAALPVLAVPLAAMGVLAAGRALAALFPRRKPRLVGRAALLVGGLTAVASLVGLASSGVTSSVGSVFHQPAESAQSQIVSTKQVDFMEDIVPGHVPADQRLLGDPWDGSALSQLYGSREPVFPHVNGQWDAARQELAWRLQEIEHNPAVCAALDELRVRYVLYNPHAFGGGDPAGNHFPGPHAAVEAGLFARVATDGETSLYRIDQCGELR